MDVLQHEYDKEATIHGWQKMEKPDDKDYHCIIPMPCKIVDWRSGTYGKIPKLQEKD